MFSDEQLDAFLLSGKKARMSSFTIPVYHYKGNMNQCIKKKEEAYLKMRSKIVFLHIRHVYVQKSQGVDKKNEI